MRIFIIVDNDRFFIPDMLSLFIAQYKGDLIGIGLARKKYASRRKQLSSSWSNFKRRLIIFGPGGLLKLFIRLKWQDFRYFFQGKPCSSKQVAQKFKIRYHELFGVNSPETSSLLKQYNLDLIISIQDQIFKKKLIRLPKIGCINKHAALLPKYRGVWPIFWAILYNEKKVGLTIHWIDEGIDTGKIIVQKQIPIKANDSLFNLYTRVFKLCPQSLIEAINKIDKDPKCGFMQSIPDEKYFSFPKRKDVKRFKKLGKKIL